MIRHRLYLTARFLAALLASAVIGLLTVMGVHDYTVQRADWRCFEEQWNEAIKQARKNDAERATRNCTPEILRILEARERVELPGAPFDPDAYLATTRSLSELEEKCFWIRSGEIVALPTEETNRIELRCNLQVARPDGAQPDGFVPDRRVSEDEMIADLRATRAFGDKQLEQHISQRLADGRAIPGRPKLVPPEDLPDELQKLSTRAWRPGPRQGRHWREDAVIAVLALVPLLTLVGVRRWLMWLKKPEA